MSFTISAGFRDELHRVVRQESARTIGQQSREGYDGVLADAPPIAMRSARCAAVFVEDVVNLGDAATVDHVVPLDGGYSPVGSEEETIEDVVNGSYGSYGFTFGNGRAPARTAVAGSHCVIVWDSAFAVWSLEPLPAFRFEMTAAKEVWSGPTLVHINRTDTMHTGETEGTAYVTDPCGAFSKMATAAGDVGAFGIAVYVRDTAPIPDIYNDFRPGAYHIAWMETPGDFWGTLASDLNYGMESVTVNVASPGTEPYTGVINGYNPFHTNFGNSITAYNHKARSDPFGPPPWVTHCCAGSTGDYVFCRWDMKAAKYWIMLVQPNAKSYQTLDVLTSVSVVVDPTTHEATVTPTKKRIQLPPWTTISDP